MGKSKDDKDNAALILQALAVLVGYLMSWTKAKPDKGGWK